MKHRRVTTGHRARTVALRGAAVLVPVAATALVVTTTGVIPAGATGADEVGTDPRVELALSSTEIALGDDVSISGRLAGTEQGGGTVALQEQRADGSWVRRAVSDTDPVEGFSFGLQPSRGQHVYRVRASAHEGRPATASDSRTVRVLRAGATPAAGADDTDPRLDAVRRTLLEDTNAARVEADISRVPLRRGLSSVAQQWAESMAASGELGHDPTYAERIPSGWTRAGENVASGLPADEVVAAWMDSEEHRANLLGAYTHLGVGFAEDDEGRTWYAVVLADY